MTKRRHNKRLYRSGLEQEAAAFLKTRQKTVEYEKIKIEWEDLRYRTYTPDFELDNGIILKEYLVLQIDASMLKYRGSTLN